MNEIYDWFNNNFWIGLFRFFTSIVAVIYVFASALLARKLSNEQEVEIEADSENQDNSENIMGIFALYSAVGLIYWGTQGLILNALSSPWWFWLITLIMIPTILYFVLINEKIAYAITYGWSIVIAIIWIINYNQIVNYVFWRVDSDNPSDFMFRFIFGIFYIVMASATVTMPSFAYMFTIKSFELSEQTESNFINLSVSEENGEQEIYEQLKNTILKVSLGLLITPYTAILLVFVATFIYGTYFL